MVRCRQRSTCYRTGPGRFCVLVAAEAVVAASRQGSQHGWSRHHHISEQPWESVAGNPGPEVAASYP